MDDVERKFRRGDTSPEHPGKVFIRYKNSREYWSTLEALRRRKALEKITNARWGKSPGARITKRKYFRTYNKLPKVKAYRSNYYSSPKVLARYRKRYAHDPQRLVEAQQREEKRRQSEELRPQREQHARDYSNEYYRKNKAIVNKKAVKRVRENPELRLKQNLSRRIRKGLQSQYARKLNRTFELLGCTFAEFRVYLEKQFEVGMTWENYGRDWEIDHRVPLRAFRLADPNQACLAFNFRNSRPLWKSDNRRKSDKMEDGTNARKSNIIPFREAVA